MKTTFNPDQKNFTRAALGVNMLDRCTPEVIRDDGVEKELTVRIGNPVHDPDFFCYITRDEKFNDHVDIDGTAFTFLYDLGTQRDVDGIYVSCFHNGLVDYTIGEFEVYASNSRETLLNPENRVIYYDNRNKMVFHISRNAADFYYDVEDLSCRYVAFRQVSTNSVDGMSRIKNFCLYNKDYTFGHRYVSTNYKGGELVGVVPQISGSFNGLPENLTIGSAMDDYEAVTLKDAAVSFKLNRAVSCDHAIIITKGEADISADCGLTLADKKAAEFGRFIYTYHGNGEKNDVINFKVNGEATIDYISLYKDFRSLTVDTENIITEDFLGVGANVLPMHLFESSRLRGFTEQYMELEKRRIAAAHPNVIRLWFQIDWFVMDEDGYLNRKYVFNSPKMQALYKELDAFKANDIEIELNFGWKVGYTAQSWFSFPNVFNKKNSAPRDLDHFATSCSDCIRELIVNRGYDNIKYLTFYNESNGGATPGGWDFVVPDDMEVKAYWLEMLKKCDAQLKKAGLRDLVKIWATEVSGSYEAPKTYEDWLPYFNENAPDLFEYASLHLYRTSYEESVSTAKKCRKLAGLQHPLCITEYGTYNYGKFEGIDFDFERSNVSATLGFINGGCAAMLYWILSGVYIDEHFFHMGNEFFWPFPTETGRGTEVSGTIFYELSLLNHYIPRHSKILSTSVSDNDMHATAAMTADGNYTIVAEFKDNSAFNRNLEIKLPKAVNKKFYKHIYTHETPCDGNMLIPPVVDTFEVGDTIKDTIDGSYALVVYTTLPPKKQVIFPDGITIQMKPGEQRQLKAQIIDGAEGDTLKWSLCDCHYNLGYPGEITEDGFYTASDKHYADNAEGNVLTAYAVKAELPTGEYGIQLIKVTK